MGFEKMIVGWRSRPVYGFLLNLRVAARLLRGSVGTP